ncbi:branched chain amino acid/phenylalanine ABC transporter periplasmic binding protein [Pseudomonas sp. IT-P44]|jgi:branched-chain amino acid transport system substrate-binding protein|uniref:Branched-chain amino acid ABC transporter substrate-binding protein n=2 Tax=Pseudomonas fluorescens group TaxID=136843 RepID=A0ABY8MUU3_9PSED|nr:MULTISPECIES: branched-chain amino acid ABC transporter substrate-binding protein [Pseudomonas]EJM73222.1 ABC-type branched-chain amino acid transport system, periplasmic component [Pseudomonas sp. GM60]EJM81804.1 ABC-type branched-chain amino acid transport system, periplasmic component [Pseudomonas sp. GM67]MBD9546728.1 branched-chain amino acid ABC transporter substrate-binding protein [Pseudomonas sp. PDM01]MBD9590054.1 branched-chain amino acid ABC transporter substrate-binding protein 
MSQTFYKKGFLALAVAAALGVSAFAQADVKIGVAGPMTGANAAFGEQYMKGAQAAADAINASGGVNGEKIVLVKGDDACEPKQAVTVAKDLTNQKVAGVVGHFCSSSTIPASEIYDEAGIIAITPGSTNPQVTERGLSAMFRMCGRDDQQGIVAGDYIVDVLKGKKVVVLHDKDTYGQGLADATKAQLAKRGVTPVLYEGLTRGEKDFSAVVTKIRAAGADVVYFGGLHPEAGPLVRQLREQGLKDVKFMSDDGIVTDELVTTAGGPQNVDGVYMTFGADPRLLPDSKTVVDTFRKAGTEPEGYTLYAYASVQTLAAAFNGAKSNSGEKAAEWLKKNPVKTVMGEKTWDAKGDLKVSDYVVYQWDKDGKYHQLEKQK